jgi:hypothetical protein
MKSNKKIPTLIFIVLFITTALFAQNSGSIVMTNNDWNVDYYYSTTLNVTPNTPIRINYKLNTYDYLEIQTTDNGSYRQYASAYAPTNGYNSITVISTTGVIYIYSEYSWNGMSVNPVFEINYAVDPSYTVTQNPSIIQNDQFIAGKLGVGVNPVEKFEVNGSARISNRLSVGSSYMNNSTKFSVQNNTDNYGINSYSYKNTTSNLYGIYTYAGNPSGNVYGLYSSVGGTAGKRWAGYFNGGDVEVNGGAIRANNDIIIGKGNNQYIFSTQSWMPNNPPKVFIAPKIANTNVWDWDNQIIFDHTGSLLVTGGNIGIGTTSPTSKLHLVASSSSSPINAFTLDVNSFSTVENMNVSTFFRVRDIGAGTTPFVIKGNGNVGIGTDAPDHMLTVKGTIHAREVLVDLNGPLADYVFEPDYTLMPLSEVESFVKANKHLPEIPSAAEVKENGLNMGEMQNKLLQKIEELTLYVIELQKTNEKQNAEIEALKQVKK